MNKNPTVEIKELVSRNWKIILLSLLMLVGLTYRVRGLRENYSFWTDENHVAIFARAILERGKPVLANGYSTRAYQWLQYWLSAISAKVFGLNEFAIRFPSVIFGILTIWAVYLLGGELFNKNVGLISAFLVTFLKIEILWSRQARPYQALQFFYLLGLWFIYKLTEAKRFKWQCFLGFLTCGILASFMHGLGLVILFVGLVWLFLVLQKNKITFLGLILTSLIILFFPFKDLVIRVFSKIGRVNNIFYYRVFLLHNYFPLVILSFLGVIGLALQKKYRELFLILFVLGVQGFIVSFILPQPFLRYFYIVFPFVVLLGVEGLFFIASFARKKHKIIAGILLFLLILSLGRKVAISPQKVYSLNEDMQEIPEVDWKKVYSIVAKKREKDPSKILIANWNDLPVWYLGEGSLDYLTRDLSKTKDPLSGAEIINTKDKFIQVVENSSGGIVVLDSWDDMIPKGIREFCFLHLNKIAEIDRIYNSQPRFWSVYIFEWSSYKQ